MTRYFITLVISIVAAFTSVSAVAQAPRTYVAAVQAVNDCPAGQVRIKMRWQDSPLYSADIVFAKAPDDVSACADVSGIKEPVKLPSVLLVTYKDGVYTGVPRVRTH